MALTIFAGAVGVMLGAAGVGIAVILSLRKHMRW